MDLEQKRENLSALLIKYAAKNGLSGHQLARRLRISQPSVRAYMDGVTYPSEENRRKIARGLGISFEELESELEGRPIEPQAPIEEVLREIRVMSEADFIRVFEVVSSRAARTMRGLAVLQDEAELHEQIEESSSDRLMDRVNGQTNF